MATDAFTWAVSVVGLKNNLRESSHSPASQN